MTSHATARLKASAAQYGGRMRRTRRRANCGDAVEPPAVAGRRQGQREAGQHDEHDDREPPVDEPAGPERCPVHRIAGERAQEDVVHHHEQRGQSANAVQAGQPPRLRAGGRGHWGDAAPARARPRARDTGRRRSRRASRRRLRAERAQEAVAEGAHRPDRRLRARAHAVDPAPPVDPAQHRRVVGDHRDRHVVARRPVR